MLLRVIIWMIVLFLVAKVTGAVIRYFRGITGGNKGVFSHTARPAANRSADAEEIPYEEINEKGNQ